MSLENKTILITGATSGIGRITAMKAAELNGTVLVHGRSADKINNTVEEIKKASGNPNISGYQADLSKLESVKDLYNKVSVDHSQIDVLINNAGLGPKHDAIFKVNYFALALLSRLFIPSLEKRRGRIVNVSSAAQSPIDLKKFASSQGMTAYAESKLAVVLFSFYLAELVKDQEVKVYALDPGSLLNTQMVKESFGASERSPEIGANAQILLATSPELESKTGSFFTEEEFSRAHEQAYDRNIQKQLWEMTSEHLAEYL